MIRAAVCGLGIGMAHCAGYLAAKGATLVAVCDRIPERLDHVGGTFDSGSMLGLKGLYQEELLSKSWNELGVRCFRNLDELLDFGEFDVLSLCTPDYLHFEQAMRVIERGKNLLLEKPVALNLRDARALSAAVDRAANQGV
ncbi:MAG TPA: Gfo/Idh/MocA family oxidoreductase, partial [Spirochaetia bacterium]|nr:Gfo/Idh/MocA family oxidoreductase [Spirochaetia bacterium]